MSPVEEATYREMRCSRGGVMLLVRLYADLAAQPPEVVRKMRTFDLHQEELPSGSRLAVTYSWLERQFGASNAVRAVCETAAEVIRHSTSR